jgi:hypothetical protein
MPSLFPAAGALLRRPAVLSCLAVLATLCAAPAASAQTGMDLMMTGSNANKITAADYGLGAYFFDTYRARLNGNEDGDQTQGPFGPRHASLKFESYAQFEQMVAARRVDPLVIKTVKYDPENWDLTPNNEKANLPLYMKKFVDLCRAAGFQECGLAPSRDVLLYNGAGTWCSRYGGGASNLDDAYLNKCNIPAQMARANPDFAQVQSQVRQDCAACYKDFLAKAAAKARAVDPTQVVWGGLSTNYDNEGGADMTRAVRATYPSIVSGFYYTISSDAIASEAVPHLRALRAAGI